MKVLIIFILMISVYKGFAQYNHAEQAMMEARAELGSSELTQKRSKSRSLNKDSHLSLQMLNGVSVHSEDSFMNIAFRVRFQKLNSFLSAHGEFGYRAGLTESKENQVSFGQLLSINHQLHKNFVLNGFIGLGVGLLTNEPRSKVRLFQVIGLQPVVWDINSELKVGLEFSLKQENSFKSDYQRLFSFAGLNFSYIY